MLVVLLSLCFFVRTFIYANLFLTCLLLNNRLFHVFCGCFSLLFFNSNSFCIFLHLVNEKGMYTNKSVTTLEVLGRKNYGLIYMTSLGCIFSLMVYMTASSMTICECQCTNLINWSKYWVLRLLHKTSVLEKVSRGKSA